MVVFYNFTILVSVPISLNCFFNFFGVVPNAPTVEGLLSLAYPIFSSILFSDPFVAFYVNFLPLFNFAIKGTCKVNNFALMFGLIYYYHIRTSCLMI